MKKPSPERTLTVVRSVTVTPNMQRLTLGGPELSGFPEGQEGNYIKLIFTEPGMNKPVRRTYTILEQRVDEIDVDFVLHPAPHGPASNLAMQAKVGDQIKLSGPGAKQELYTQADWFFFVGDMTALPSIIVYLKSLPDDTKGYVVVEILDESDKQELTMPSQMQMHWVVKNNQSANDEGLAETITEAQLCTKTKSLPFLDGKPSVWVACEFSSMKNLRHYFKVEKEIPKQALYVSSYWKRGLEEDKHKVVKREDSLAQPDLP